MTRKWETSLIWKGMVIWYRKTWITMRTRVIETERNLIAQIASLCPCELKQISVVSCKVISSETKMCKLCLEVQVNHWLWMLRGDEKGKFDPWVHWARYFQETVRVWVAGGGSAETPSGPVFWRKGLRRAWVQRRAERLIVGQACHSIRLQWHGLFILPRLSPYYLFKEDKEQFMLKENVDSETNAHYLTWKTQNGNF